MKFIPNSVSRFARITACAILLAGLPLLAQESKPAASGSWTWAAPGRNGGPGRTNTLTLKIEDSKLTGKLASPGRGGQTTESDISEGKIEGETISFVVIREINGNSVKNKYSGKIAGDKIHGTVQFTRNGEDQSRDWDATRSPAK